MQKQVESYKNVDKFIQNYGRASKENSNCVTLPLIQFYYMHMVVTKLVIIHNKVIPTTHLLELFVNNC